MIVVLLLSYIVFSYKVAHHRLPMAKQSRFWILDSEKTDTKRLQTNLKNVRNLRGLLKTIRINRIPRKITWLRNYTKTKIRKKHTSPSKSAVILTRKMCPKRYQSNCEYNKLETSQGNPSFKPEPELFWVQIWRWKNRSEWFRKCGRKSGIFQGSAKFLRIFLPNLQLIT